MAAIPFKIIESEPDPELVSALEDLLQRAKAGKIRSIAFAIAESEGSFTTCWKGDLHPNFRLCTAISRLAWRYQNEAFREVARFEEGA